MSRLPAGWALFDGGVPPVPATPCARALVWLAQRALAWRALASTDPQAARRARALKGLRRRAKGGR